MRSLIFHSLKMHRVQTISIMLSVALSVAICVALVLTYGGVTRGIEISSERGGSDIMVVPESAASYVTSTELLYTGVPVNVYMNEDVVDEITNIDGITNVTAQFFSQTLSAACCSASGETRLIGVDFSTDFIVTPLVDEGVAKSLTDNEVIVGVNVDGIYDGKLTVYGVEYTVSATMAQTSGDLDSSIVMNIDKARDISRDTEGFESYWARWGDPSTLISSVMIDVDENANYQSIVNQLMLLGNVSVYEHSDIAERAIAQLQSVFALLLGAAIAMIIVALLQLFARFYSCVWDRKGELALYRAVGASQGDLRKLICGEIGTIMLVGVVVGAIVGIILQVALVNFLLDSMAFPFIGLSVLEIVGVLAAVIVIFAIIALLAVLWPLRQIGHLDPSLAMQQGDID